MIQKVINRLTVLGGGKMYFTTGSYIISKSLTLDGIANITITGSKEAILKLADNANCHVIYINNTRRVRIEKIEINGNKNNQTPSDGIRGIEVWNSSDIFIRNIYIHDTYGATIGLHDCTRAGIYNSVLENTNGDCTFAFNVDYLKFVGNVCKDYVDTGVAHFGKYTVIANNIFDGGYCGVYLGTAGVKTEEVAVVGNVFRNHTTAGVKIDEPKEENVEPTEKITVAGNTFEYCNAAIWMEAKDYSGIRNIVIANNVVLASTKKGIIAGTLSPDTSPIYKLVIIGNIVAYSGEAGICLVRAKHSLIANNIVYNNGQSTPNPGILLLSLIHI